MFVILLVLRIFDAMSRYWRIDAGNGREYEHIADATRVLSALRMAFAPSNIIASSLLSNHVLDVSMYLRTWDCRMHGTDTHVFMLAEATETITASCFVGYVAAQLHNKPLDMRTKMELSNMKFREMTCGEYDEQQDAHRAFMRTHNGTNTI